MRIVFSDELLCEYAHVSAGRLAESDPAEFDLGQIPGGGAGNPVADLLDFRPRQQGGFLPTLIA